MTGEGWVERKRTRGPDIWEYRNGKHSYNLGIALLKRKDKVIAKFFGPKELPNKIMIVHIESVYATDSQLVLHRIIPLPQKDIVIQKRSYRRNNMN